MRVQPSIKVAQPAPRARERYDRKMQLMGIAEKITRYGWLVDRDALAGHKQAAQERIWLYTDKFLNLTGLPREALGSASLGSTHVVKEFFRDNLNAPDVCFDRKTKRPQFNTATLVEWATADRSKDYAAPAAALYALRKNIRTRDFCNTYQRFSADDGRIHFQFNVCGTQTGRWTSSTRMRFIQDTDRKTISCNAQQIPKAEPTFDFQDGNGEVKLARSLRNIFIADPGCQLLVADFDQLELRLIAYVYGVKKLIAALDDPRIDIHFLTASYLWPASGIKPTDRKDQTPAHKRYRNAVKSCTYGMSYQMTLPNRTGRYPALFKTLKASFPTITEHAITILADRFFDAYPEIKQGMERTKKQIDEHGFVELTIDGRRLYYPVTMRGYNQALNFPMQGTGGAICDRAVAELDDLLDWDNGAQVRAQVHDEVVIQCREDEVEKYAPLLERAMSRPAQIGQTYAGIPAAAQVGINWSATVERS